MKQFAIFKAKASVEKILGVQKEIRAVVDRNISVECTSRPAQVWATAPDYWPYGDSRFAAAEKIMARHFGPSQAAAALGSIKSDKKAASSRENGKLGGRPKEVLAKLYYYDGGQTLAEFRRGGANDWFVWSPKRGQRLATYKTKKELLEAYHRSNNSEGGYGCTLLKLDVDVDE